MTVGVTSTIHCQIAPAHVARFVLHAGRLVCTQAKMEPVNAASLAYTVGHASTIHCQAAIPHLRRVSTHVGQLSLINLVMK
jgi:hypothetical protein